MTGDWPDHLTPDEPTDLGLSGSAAQGDGQPYSSDLFSHVYGQAESDLTDEHDGDEGGADEFNDDSLVAAADFDLGDAGGSDESASGPDPDIAAYSTEGSATAFDPDYDGALAFDQQSGIDWHPDDAGATYAAVDDWARAIGPGAVDPSGSSPPILATLHIGDPSESSRGPGSYEPASYETTPFSLAETLLGELDTDHWTEVSLLERLPDVTNGPHTRDGTDAVGGIQALWDRISPDEPMPVTDSGSPDVTAALNLLSVRAGNDGPMFDVIDVARRALGD